MSRRTRREERIIPFLFLSFLLHSVLIYFFPGFLVETALTTSLTTHEGEIIFIEMLEEEKREEVPHYDVKQKEEVKPDPIPDPLPEPKPIIPVKEEVVEELEKTVDPDSMVEVLPEEHQSQILTSDKSEEVFTIPEGDDIQTEAPPRLVDEPVTKPDETLRENLNVEKVEEELQEAPPLKDEQEVKRPAPPPPQSLVAQSLAVYPKAAENEELEGKVLMEVRVSPFGKVENIRILESSGHPVIDDNAYQTVLRGWVFKEEPFAYRIQLSLDYRIGENTVVITFKGVEYIYD